jgi:cation diffusion facilitator CzcD-associated flavoprotein CzcO
LVPDIEGPGGEDLVDRWNRTGLEAHRGIAVADVPNLFFLLGPNTGGCRSWYMDSRGVNRTLWTLA